MGRQWSPQQAAALDAVGRWHREARAGNGPQVFRLFGFAGTGKTTLAKHLAAQIGGETCYAAFTGKAALMMQRNGCAGASTIHSLIYNVDEESEGEARFIWDAESPARDADLIVIDECSMVGEELARDLLRYRRPILVLGDPAQLPPVNSAGFFTENVKPDAMLTEIHRQAAESPIIRMATKVREGGRLEVGQYGTSEVVRRGTLGAAEVMAHDQILVGKNVTRQGMNRKVRRLLHRDGWEPEAGDKLVCLKNDKTAGILNGGLFEIYDNPHRPDLNHFAFEVKSEDFPKRHAFEVKARRECFEADVNQLLKEDFSLFSRTQVFDYGYALTVHKSQGSQWDSVVLYDEKGIMRNDARRWLYTGITRAADRLTVVV